MVKVIGLFVIFVSICSVTVESGGFLSGLDHLGESISRAVNEGVKKSLDKALWFDGPNVCTEEKTGPKQSSDKSKESKGKTVITNNGSTIITNGGSSLIINNQICNYANEFKLDCKSEVTENGRTQERTRIYQCCDGYVGTYDKNHARKCVPKK